jgi:hypothetical protein
LITTIALTAADLDAWLPECRALSVRVDKWNGSSHATSPAEILAEPGWESLTP